MAADPHTRPSVLRRADRRHDLPDERHLVPLVRGAVEGERDERLQAAARPLLAAGARLFGYHHRALGDGSTSDAGRFRGNSGFFYLMLLGIMAPGILVGFGFAIMMRLLGIELA